MINKHRLGEDGGAGGIEFAGDVFLEGEDDFGGGRDGVNAGVGGAAMGVPAGDGDIEGC